MSRDTLVDPLSPHLLFGDTVANPPASHRVWRIIWIATWTWLLKIALQSCTWQSDDESKWPWQELEKNLVRLQTKFWVWHPFRILEEVVSVDDGANPGDEDDDRDEDYPNRD